jgi:hypothetical protein
LATKKAQLGAKNGGRPEAHFVRDFAGPQAYAGRMIIFPLLLILFACAALAGWCFGVIRATTTFVGLLVSLIVARMFPHSLQSILPHVGIQNPALLWMLAPALPFLISLIVFKIIGLVVQQKVNHYYKYKAGDLRMGLWQRLNPRLGLCVGLANALVYMVLISLVIYVASYPTVQLAAGNGDHWSVRFLNQAAHELERCGLTKVAAAVDPMPASYFEAADLAGLIYHNDLLEARLGRYPAFISLGEEDVFKKIAADKNFRELRQRQPPFMDIVNHPLLQPIVGDPNMLGEIWDLVTNNFQDLQVFLQTGLSEKYAGTRYLLVGRWDVNSAAAFSEYQAANPTITPTEMNKAKREMRLIFTNTTTMVATLDNKIYLKNIGTISYVTNTIQVTPGQTQPQRSGGRATGPGPASSGAAAFIQTVNSPEVFGYGGGRGGGGGGRGGGGGGGPAPAPAPARPAAPVVTTVKQVLTTVKLDSLQGTWSGEGPGFQIRIQNRRGFSATVDGDKLTLAGMTFTPTVVSYPVVFDREY